MLEFPGNEVRKAQVPSLDWDEGVNLRVPAFGVAPFPS